MIRPSAPFQSCSMRACLRHERVDQSSRGGLRWSGATAFHKLATAGRPVAWRVSGLGDQLLALAASVVALAGQFLERRQLRIAGCSVIASATSSRARA